MAHVRNVVLYACVFSAIVVFDTVNANPVNKKLTINILHTNDMHGRFEQISADSSNCTSKEAANGQCYGGFARIATLVRQGRSSITPTFFLNAGDTYQGSVLFSIHTWKIASKFLEFLEPDAMCLGNHEFDNGVKDLLPFVKRATYPIVTANLDLTKEPELRKEKALMNSTILEANGRKIGVIGYITPDTKIESDVPNIEFLDEILVLREEAKKLKAQGVNIIIGLGHSGFNRDKEIAAEVEDLDLIIGGHTNTFLYNGKPPLANPKKEDLYPVVVQQKSGRKVYVVQAYAYTMYMGNLTITFNEAGEIEAIAGNPILVDKTVEQAPDVLRELDIWRADVEALANEEVGSTNVALQGSEKICRFQECNLGNLITDAIVDFGVNKFNVTQGWTIAPIAIINAGSIRTSISKGKQNKLKMGDVMPALPFGHKVAFMEVNKTIIYQMLEWSVSDRVQGSRSTHGGRFLQFSGIRVIFDMSRPVNSRVISVKVLCNKCDVPVFEDIQSDKIYPVLVDSYILNGGDGYRMLLPFQSETYGTVLDVLLLYIKKTSPVYPGIDGRISILNDNRIELPINNQRQVRGRASSYSLALILTVLPIFAIKL